MSANVENSPDLLRRTEPVGAPNTPAPWGPTHGRYRAVLLFLIAFVVIATCMRIVLLVGTRSELTFDASLLGIFAVGFLFDVATGIFAALPLVALLALAPRSLFTRPIGRWTFHLVTFGVLCVLLFSAVSEWTFWAEFGARFNFIAVDYLIYTTEVLANIRESYPMPLILGGIALASGALTYLVARRGIASRWCETSSASFRERLQGAAVWGAFALVLGLSTPWLRVPNFANQYHEELAKNGVWSLFEAFWDNELDYERFYASLPSEQAFEAIHRELGFAPTVTPGAAELDTRRAVAATRPEHHLNVVQITVESLSGEYLGTFGNTHGLTPNLDALVEKSLFFDNFYATGTRTDRGMEALVLGIPPTPGRSLVKRPHNEELFTLGSVLNAHGYDTAFLYGGYGYFDNMNTFFSGNGYRILDRAQVSDADITFANAWGACDQDLFRWTLKEADRVHTTGTPFHFFLMTTSNHRPYTFPDGNIDLESKVDGRRGAVKYTDFAIGQFLAEASTHPWFDETIFVIVADHCAGSAGKTELPVQQYHIPLFIYAPGGQVAPQRVATLCSQIDFAPTLLGLLGISYDSRFFGVDALSDAAPQRALIGTYQLLGLLEPDHLTVLGPQKRVAAFDVDLASRTQVAAESRPASEQRAIAYYSTASWMFQHGLYRMPPPNGSGARTVFAR